jgi:hypothetical protein
LLAGCEVEVLDEQRARSVGTLAARASTADRVGACVVEGALRRHDLVVTSDVSDLAAIAEAAARVLEIKSP